MTSESIRVHVVLGEAGCRRLDGAVGAQRRLRAHKQIT